MDNNGQIKLIAWVVKNARFVLEKRSFRSESGPRQNKECRTISADPRQKHEGTSVCSGVVRFRRSSVVVHEDENAVHLISFIRSDKMPPRLLHQSHHTFTAVTDDVSSTATT